MEIKSYPIKKTKKATKTKSKNKKFKSNISVNMTSEQHKKAAHQNSVSFN